MNTTEQFDEQLRGTFARSVQNVTINPEAWTEFQDRVNSPRSTRVERRHGMRRAPLLVAAAAAVSLGGAALVGQSVFSPPAYASWHSEPDALTTAEQHAVTAECGASNPVSFDRRGHHVYVLSQENHQWRSCVATLPGQSNEGLGQTYTSIKPAERANSTMPTTTAPLTLIDVKAPEGNHVTGEPSPLVYVSGRAAPNVTRVTVTTSKGLVEASVKNGYFTAWWPGNDSDTAVVRAYAHNGHEVGQLNRLNYRP